MIPHTRKLLDDLMLNPMTDASLNEHSRILIRELKKGIAEGDQECEQLFRRFVSTGICSEEGDLALEHIFPEGHG
jgi:hypothetical protein